LRTVIVEVRWPGGRPARGVTVWAETGHNSIESGETDVNGVARLTLLEGATYKVETRALLHQKGRVTTVASDPVTLIPELRHHRITLTLPRP
jgi:hypothetical protein